jgi:hypothetical protein
MTFCFAFTANRLSLVVADTRITGTSEGLDLPLNEADSVDFLLPFNGSLVHPYRYRKIARAGLGWVATAGALLPGRRLLVALGAEKASEPEEALHILKSSGQQVISEVHQETGLRLDPLFDVIFIGAPFGKNLDSWSIRLNREEGAILVSMSGSQSNAVWPPGISETEAEEAEKNFSSSVSRIQRLADILRAAVRLVETASRSAGCSRNVQIGFTFLLREPSEGVIGYVDGQLDMLLSMTDDELERQIQKA